MSHSAQSFEVCSSGQHDQRNAGSGRQRRKKRYQERNRTLNTLSMSVIFFYVYKDRVSSGNLGGLPHPIWASPPFPTCPLSPVLCPKVFIRLEKTYRYGKRPGSSIRIKQIGSATTMPTGVPRALQQPEFQIARPPNFDYATTSHASMCPTTVMHQRLTNAYCPMPFMSLIRT